VDGSEEEEAAQKVAWRWGVDLHLLTSLGRTREEDLDRKEEKGKGDNRGGSVDKSIVKHEKKLGGDPAGPASGQIFRKGSFYMTGRRQTRFAMRSRA